MLITFKSADISAHNLDTFPAAAIHKRQSRVRPRTAPPSFAQSCISVELRFLGSSAASAAIARLSLPPVASHYAFNISARLGTRSVGVKGPQTAKPDVLLPMTPGPACTYRASFPQPVSGPLSVSAASCAHFRDSPEPDASIPRQDAYKNISGA